MPKFIICYADRRGRSEVEIIEAETLTEAELKAAQRSMAEGILDDDLADTTWAEPYTPERALEYGLETEA